MSSSSELKSFSKFTKMGKKADSGSGGGEMGKIFRRRDESPVAPKFFDCVGGGSGSKKENSRPGPKSFLDTDSEEYDPDLYNPEDDEDWTEEEDEEDLPKSALAAPASTLGAKKSIIPKRVRFSDSPDSTSSSTSKIGSSGRKGWNYGSNRSSPTEQESKNQGTLRKSGLWSDDSGIGNGIDGGRMDRRKPFNSSFANSAAGAREFGIGKCSKPTFIPPAITVRKPSRISYGPGPSAAFAGAGAPIEVPIESGPAKGEASGSAEKSSASVIPAIEKGKESCPKYVIGLASEVVNDAHAVGIFVNPDGYWTLRFSEGVHVDITMDGAIRIINWPCRIIMAMAGSTAGLVHPTGRMYQYGSRVECSGMDERGIVKYAKCSFRGITFSSERNALVYIIDQAGVRSTNDVFSDMSGDFTAHIFLKDTVHGPEYVDQLVESLGQAHFWIDNHGSENWIINGFRVSMSLDACVRVSQINSVKMMLRTSAATGTTLLATPYVHCTASMGPDDHRHLYVKRGERRVHFDGSVIILRNGGHAAGIDPNNKVEIY